MKIAWFDKETETDLPTDIQTKIFIERGASILKCKLPASRLSLFCL